VSDLRNIASIEHNYTSDQEVYLKLGQSELCSLGLALREALNAHGVTMMHEEIIEGPDGGLHPSSHIGTLARLYQRVDAAYHGRKTWNAEWRKREPYASLGFENERKLAARGGK
jgi:hypothetical protein